METMDLTTVTTDGIETALTDLENQIGARRHLQMRLLTELDQRQAPMWDGSRNLAEWATARMDLTPETALRLTQTAVRLQDQPALAEELKEGTVSFDRVVEESRLVTAGADPELVAGSRGWDLAGLRRMTARQRRIARQDEQRTFQDRSIKLQPTLDQTYYKVWGGLPGVDGRTLEQALLQRADQFPSMPDGKRCPRNQRFADALVAIAQDSLDGNQTEGTSTTPLVSIFIDSQLAASTGGEAGVEIDIGSRIGPLTLEEILCGGSVEILTTGPDGTPLSVGPTARTIPPKLKRFILHRDRGACTADGCQSRYRLQPHHITPRSQGGTQQPDNLTSLCNRSSFLRRCLPYQQGRRKVERAITTTSSSTATATASTPTAHPNAADSSDPTAMTLPRPAVFRTHRGRQPNPTAQARMVSTPRRPAGRRLDSDLKGIQSAFSPDHRKRCPFSSPR
jgi:hypothetical protein